MKSERAAAELLRDASQISPLRPPRRVSDGAERSDRCSAADSRRDTWAPAVSAQD
jgi:hypothetical protein